MSRTLNIYDATANYDQRIAPIKKPRKQRERQPCRGIETSGSDAAPLEQGKLAAEKKVLRFDRSPRSDGQRNQVDKCRPAIER